MKVYIVFHEADPFTLYCMGDDDGGFSLYFICFFHSLYNLFDVVSIYLEYMPVEGAPFISQRLEVHDIAGTAVELQFVFVDKGVLHADAAHYESQWRLVDDIR